MTPSKPTDFHTRLTRRPLMAGSAALCLSVASSLACADWQPLRASADVLAGSASGSNQEGMGIALRASASLGNTVASGELARQSRFNLTGTQVSGQISQGLTARQTLILSANAGESALYPSIGGRATLVHAWSDKADWRTAVGLSHQRLRNDIQQNALLLEQTWYTPVGPVIQLGLLSGRSSRGDTPFFQRYLAASHRYASGLTVSLRLENARESFQATGVDSAIFDFRSNTQSLLVGVPMTDSDNLRLRLESYSTPFYDRRQVGLGWERLW